MLTKEGKKIRYGIRKGDMVMIIAGGNDKKKPLKGKVGKLLRFVGREKDRAIVEGLNYVSHHERAAGPSKPGGKIPREAGVHVSNLMFYVEKLKRPVRIKHKVLADGTKVRGYMDPKNKEFVQIAEEASKK